jgi:hypothetical protein
LLFTLVSKSIRGKTYYVTVPAFLYGGGTGTNNDILDAQGSSANNLTNGGGLNGSYLLNAATVHENSQKDTLSGTTTAGLDWFLAGLTDAFKNKKPGEDTTTIS